MKKELAQQYIELKKQFDGKEFKANIKAHNIEWLVKEFTTNDLKEKINAVKRALTEKNKQQEWIRYYVVADFANFKKEWSFSSKNREELFAACVNFASGFVNGYVINNENTPISTNACQSIDGFIWWNAISGKNVVYIKDENGEIITK